MLVRCGLCAAFATHLTRILLAVMAVLQTVALENLTVAQNSRMSCSDLLSGVSHLRAHTVSLLLSGSSAVISSHQYTGDQILFCRHNEQSCQRGTEIY